MGAHTLCCRCRCRRFSPEIGLIDGWTHGQQMRQIQQLATSLTVTPSMTNQSPRTAEHCRGSWPSRNTVWSVSCLLFFYSRCPRRSQGFVKVGGTCPLCPMELAPLVRSRHEQRWFESSVVDSRQPCTTDDQR